MTQAYDLDRIIQLNASAGFNRWMDLHPVRAREGSAELALSWKPELGQYSGFLHAGVIAALLDTVAGFAATTLVGPVIASHLSVDYLSPAIGQSFSALGTVTKAGKRQIFAQSQLFASGPGESKLVATATFLMLPA